eukprot:GHUV01022194.1.p1 GENE.GHUV01022194.1~~GHUV01022194.1.p1  ORF type:complete len:230 (+),score=57.47 GHUV01022194.1:653-1342(+)
MHAGDASAVDELLKELDDLPSSTQKQHIRPGELTRSAQTHAQSSIKPAAAVLKRQQRSQSTSSRQPSLSGLDALLEELQQDCHGTQPAQVGGRITAISSSNGASSTSSSQARVKCSCAYLGGSSSKRGRSTALQATPSCCDSLRCTACDFKVIWSSDVRWADGVDYMFFRNCYPTKEKLSAKMQRCPGSCAYCCQCSWVSSSSLTKVSVVSAGAGADSAVRWVCAGHTS